MKWIGYLRLRFAFRTPVVPQLSAFDCGAAALGTILEYNDISASYVDVLDKAGTSRDGTSTSGLLRAAKTFGLAARIRHYTAAQALTASMPSIVFWGGSHFVVLEGATNDRVAINDPQSGRRVISKERFFDRYTGRLIEFDHPNKRRSVFRRATASQSRLPRTVSSFCVFSITCLALAWIGLRQPEYDPLALANSGLFVLFLGVMALIASWVLFSTDTNPVSQTTKYLPWKTRQIWPQPLFSKKGEGPVFDAPIAWILSLIALPVGSTVFGPGSGFVTLGAALLLVALLSAFLGLFERQRRLAQKAIASTGTHRLRAQFAELCLHPDQLRLLLRDSAFASTFMDWQRRRDRETQSLSRYDVFKTGCVGIAGATVILAAVVSESGVAPWLVLSGFLLLSVSVFLFAGRSAQIDPTRIHAIRRAIESCPVTGNARAMTGLDASRFSELHLKDVTFGFDPDAAPILSNLSLTLKDRDIVAVAGPAACGKTSLGRLAAGHFPPQSGIIKFGPPDAESARICFLSEVPPLTKSIDDIPEDLVSELRLTKLVETDRKRKSNRGKPMIRFSQGERQRLSIALEIASKPSLLILDDALTCVDEEDLSCIIQAVRSRGITCLILSNHWPLLRLCDRIELLEHKRLTPLGAPEDFETYRDLLTNQVGIS